MLKVNTTLTEINVYYNQIRDKGARDLAEALKVNTTLTKINLSNNEIRDEGAKGNSRGAKGEYDVDRDGSGTLQSN